MKNTKILFLLISGLVLLFPASALAIANTYQAEGTTICYEGLVPCGHEYYTGEPSDGECQGDASDQVMPCQFCHLFVMFKGIVDLLILPPTGLIWLLALVMVVIAGILYMIGQASNPALIKQANSILTAVFIGLGICLLAWILVNIFFLVIGVADWTGLVPSDTGGWFQINCPVEMPS